MPEFGKQFLFAGDMNAERRGHKARNKALKTGMAAGEPDLRVYMAGGQLGLIELKTATGRLSPAQRDRHELLRRLGFTRLAVVKATTRHDAAAQTVSVVLGWLASNDNAPSAQAKLAITKEN